MVWWYSQLWTRGGHDRGMIAILFGMIFGVIDWWFPILSGLSEEMGRTVSGKKVVDAVECFVCSFTFG